MHKQVNYWLLYLFCSCVPSHFASSNFLFQGGPPGLFSCFLSKCFSYFYSILLGDPASLFKHPTISHDVDSSIRSRYCIFFRTDQSRLSSTLMSMPGTVLNLAINVQTLTFSNIYTGVSVQGEGRGKGYACLWCLVLLEEDVGETYPRPG